MVFISTWLDRFPMKQENLKKIRAITDWGGVTITLAGIIYNIIDSGKWTGNIIALLGVTITFLGHIASKALSKFEEEEKVDDREKIEELESSIYEAEEIINNPHLKRAIHNEKMRYEDEHQDNWK